MESGRFTFKQDAYGNDIFARVSWASSLSKGHDDVTRPIALMYHGGGLLVGSSEILPQAEVKFLCDQGLVVVAPNYRLCPQVTAKEALEDCVEAYDWATKSLPGLLQTRFGLSIASERVVATGHSVGGTIALHIGACRSLDAVTAFYPMLYSADKDTRLSKPHMLPPFGTFPDFSPEETEWQAIAPPTLQISEAGLAVPGTPPAPRNRWQMHLLKHGKALSAICPDGDYETIDPLCRVTGHWPATMFVQGDKDYIPGSGVDLVQRAAREMLAAGVKEITVEIAEGQDHMFDLRIDTAQPQWQVVEKGLRWLVDHARQEPTSLVA